jgi:hypothetical protein
MRGLFVMISLAATSACASSGTSAVHPATTEMVRISSGTASGTTAMIGSTPTVTAIGGNVRDPIDKVWGLLPAVYDSLSIPIGTVDPATRTLGNSGFKIRRQLGKVPLSRYLNCGVMQGTPSADSYEIHLSVLTEVKAGESGTTDVATTIEAMARPVSLSGDYTSCSSKGVLEQAIMGVLRLKLARG